MAKLANSEGGGEIQKVNLGLRNKKIRLLWPNLVSVLCNPVGYCQTSGAASSTVSSGQTIAKGVDV